MKVNLYRLLFAAALLSLIFGCAGGGSQGTGGMRFQGTLYRQPAKMRALLPLSGITVTIGSTGDSAVTDERGFYSISTAWTTPDVELFFDGSGLDARYLLRGLPENSKVVTLDFEVNPAADAVQLINSEILTDGEDSGGSFSSGSAGSTSSASAGGASSSARSSRSSSGSNGSAEKVTICHKPDSKNPLTMTVSPDALPAHLAHGDTIGPCPDDD